MVDLLPSMISAVDEQSVTVLGYSFIACDLRSYYKHVSQHRLVLGSYIVSGRDDLVGDDENVRRRLWIDVAERGHLFVLIDYVGRNFTADDLAENCLLGHSDISCVVAVPLIVFNHSIVQSYPRTLVQ